MALKSPAFRKKFPLLVTGSLLALQPLATSFVVAAEQYDCSVSASGAWDCAPKTPAAALPPRPVHDGSAVSSSGDAPAQTGSDEETGAKPVLVTEFHFGSRDRGPFWGGAMEVAKEEDRGPAYANFLKNALAEPSIVGVHWFQYLDQPVSGRRLDGENGHLGLVGITDVPYQGFVDAVRKANNQVVDVLGKASLKTP